MCHHLCHYYVSSFVSLLVLSLMSLFLLLYHCVSPSVSFVIIHVTANVIDAQGALEMTWLKVKPEELMEPKVTMVTRERC